ncbi:MAG: hypothetical protein DHS20C08_21140 [Rhodomicrobium sp.]|nr:MAG: hypothetical protein DHS20C08_21140 [Rhodomicrobium sp.]
MLLRRFFFSLFALPLITGFVFTTITSATAAETGSEVKVVELFTSQGCSSCPPADALLESYVNRQDVVALSYSVDYWDYLGWRDTFGSAANSERQRAYAKRRGDRAVYTPQAVVNGLAHANGAQKIAISKKIKQTQADLKQLPVQLSYSKDGDTLVVTANSPVERWAEPPVLWLVHVKDVGRVQVKRGENLGKTLEYHNVVLGVEKIATMNGAQLQAKVARDKVFPRRGEHGVFLVQLGSTGPILAALEAK